MKNALCFRLLLVLVSGACFHLPFVAFENRIARYGFLLTSMKNQNEQQKAKISPSGNQALSQSSFLSDCSHFKAKK